LYYKYTQRPHVQHTFTHQITQSTYDDDINSTCNLSKCSISG